MRFRRYLLPVVAVSLLLFAPVVLAQTTGSIEGTVTDNSGAALPGVTCTATSPALQGSRSAVTSNDGGYRIVALPPGNYRVTCALAGFASVERPASVTLGGTANANMTLQISAKEEVVVSGEAPLIDVTSTTTGSNYNAKVMEKMPVSRNYADIVKSQPGVNTDTAETQGRSLALTIYGSTSVENLYVIDGINTTNVIKGFQGKSINPEFIQEVEVKTGGYQAEFGRATGGVINVITKSGGNEFHGDVFGYYNSPEMRSDVEVTDEDVAQTERTEVDRWDAGVDLGGFFVRDRLWFFGAYDRVEQETTRIPVAGNAAIINREFPLDSTSDLWSAKLTWNIVQGSTLVGTFFTDPEKRDGAINLPTSPNPVTYEGTRYIGAKDYAGRFNQLFGSFGVLTLQYARHRDRFLTKLTPEGERIRTNDNTISTTLVAVPGSGFGSIFGPTINNSSIRDAYLGTFTAYFGGHELKVGGEYEDNLTSAITRFTGGQLVRIQACRATPTSPDRCNGRGVPFTNFQGTNVVGGVFYRHDYWVSDPETLEPLEANIVEPPSLVYSAFLQDTWRITPAFTVNAGIRWDRERIQNALEEDVIDVDDMWAPRAGFVWDFMGDGSSKVYGSYGRFYYQIPTDLNVRAFGFQLQTRAFNYDPVSLNQDPNAPFARTTQGGVVSQPVDDNIKGMYQDEFSIGVEKALDPTLVVGLKGMYRKLGRAIEDRCDLDYHFEENQFNSCAIVNPGSGEKWASGDFPCHNSSERPDASLDDAKCNVNGGPAVKEAKRLFRGIELTARKSFSQNFWAQVSYIYSSLRGNYDGAARLASGQTDPGINADYDYFQFAERNAYGKLYLDRPHQFQIGGIYSAPFGLSIGLSGYVRSGPPINKNEFFNSFYPNLIHGVPRGTAGRAETEYEANLSLAYAITAGPVTITPQLYVFNVFDRQGEVRIEDDFNPAGDFDDAGNAIRDEDYGKILQRQDPRLFRAALRIAF